ncbi:MAG: Asp-tRNA(Asn)/Glu-tRNA(Gln) amidotransferase subunit GatA, partial [Clostridia bacterium]|nr:Asp-tRNA(Asn)/Glu-tRNA(Gln) amidotransferase subunit GatA [Clostridia bacterium]
MEPTRFTLEEQIQCLQTKEISSLELTQAYLAAIEKSQLGAYLTVTAEAALKAARAADRRRSRGDALSPLDGIP